MALEIRFHCNNLTKKFLLYLNWSIILYNSLWYNDQSKGCSNVINFCMFLLVVQESREIRIVLVDRGPYAPIFSNEPQPLRAVVPMWIRPYTTLLTLKSLDAELGAQVTFQIESGEYNAQFTAVFHSLYNFASSFSNNNSNASTLNSKM